MANPTLSRKTEEHFTPTENVKRLFQVIYHEQNKEDRGDVNLPKIKVSDLISKMAFYYEKIRNSIDYKEEHLLRKNAIERILKRQIVIEGAMSLKELDTKEISRHLLVELIRAGYLPNNTLPETKINELALVIEKYLKLKKYVLKKSDAENMQERGELTRWVNSLAASDIEERLGRSKIDETVADYMYKVLSPNIQLSKDSEYADDKDIQIYINIYRSFFKFDQDMLGFILFKYYNNDWEMADDEMILGIASKIKQLKQAIDFQIEHPLKRQLSRLTSRYTVLFSILIDVIKEDPTGVYDCFSNDPKAFPRHIKSMCDKRYKTTRKKLWRAAIRSIIYIFITKSVFVIALEIPATKLFGEVINSYSYIINIVFPAFLLFLMILFTKLPSLDNSLKIVEGIDEIVFEEKKRTEPFTIKPAVTRKGVLNFVFNIIYAVTFFLSFGGVVWILRKIEFSNVSIIIFIFFLALVSFFSIRIRGNAKELIIVPPKESIFSFVVDFFYVPIVSFGKWLSEKFSKVNVFVFILDFIIEAPFKIFVEIAEEWTKYVRERKDEIS